MRCETIIVPRSTPGRPERVEGIGDGDAVGRSRTDSARLPRCPSGRGQRPPLTVLGMAQLGAAERARLPDSAFAYVDSHGRRRLPIHDAGHVRNALARFNQVAFEDDAARDRARKRLLNAAKKFKIVPVGFITDQLQSERDPGARADEPIRCRRVSSRCCSPTSRDRRRWSTASATTTASCSSGSRSCCATPRVEHDGHVVETRADEFFAVFEQPAAALDTAVTVQRQLRTRASAAVTRCTRPGRDPQRLPDAGQGELHRHGRAHGGTDLRRGARRADRRVRRLSYRVGVPPPNGVRFRRLGAYA